jgi:proteasome component ECM29
MLEGLSNLEDIRLNYVEQHAERLGLDQEKLESARVNAARSSPMVSNSPDCCMTLEPFLTLLAIFQGDALDVCTRYNDAASLDAIVPVLIVNIKRGVGLNTKASPIHESLKFTADLEWSFLLILHRWEPLGF